MSSQLRKQLEMDDMESRMGRDLKVLVTAIRLPSGAIETAENREYLQEKLAYMLTAYDHDMKLKANQAIEIVGYMIV